MASLTEIWPGFVASNKFKKYTNTLPQNVVNNLIGSSDTRGGNKYMKYKKPEQLVPEPITYERSRDYPIKKENVEKFSNINYSGKYQSECSSILTHLSQCIKCRKFVQNKFAPQETEKEDNDEYLDLAIYIVTGIFILFTLDMVMKFGRRKLR